MEPFDQLSVAVVVIADSDAGVFGWLEERSRPLCLQRFEEELFLTEALDRFLDSVSPSLKRSKVKSFPADDGL